MKTSGFVLVPYVPGWKRISYRCVPNWLETCAFEMVFSVARIGLTDWLGFYGADQP